ncbi:MAG TPA: M55 family metallopeptidase [Gemmatimonadales bacterium]|nr:M55 family metallopeptidase [Gemmatimonadales bacterium]
MRYAAITAALLLPAPLLAQGAEPRDTTPPSAYFGVTEYQLAREKLEQDMQKDGFSVYIIADMEGLAGAVRNATEMRPVDRGGSPQHERFRQELTDEVNAVIAGARAAGATQFIVNEGHGGTLFRNIIVDQLDPDAILIRGYPKPIVMSTGMNPMVDAMMIVGAHANAGSLGVIAHSFAFDSFTVNGKMLNEAGIAAFIGGEMGVPMALAAGDDVLTDETKEMLGPLETVTVKTVFSHSAAAVLPPAMVHRELRAAAGRAVKRVKAGELKPLRIAKPYHVRFCLRRSFTRDDWVRETVGRLDGVTQDGGPGCFAYTSESAEAVGNLLNEIEWTVLKP